MVLAHDLSLTTDVGARTCCELLVCSGVIGAGLLHSKQSVIGPHIFIRELARHFSSC
jgi:hypothetical protein